MTTVSIDPTSIPQPTVGATCLNGATIVALRLIAPPDEGAYAVYRAICVRGGVNYHDYAVWYLYARPEGFETSRGDYFHTIEEAITEWKR